MSAYLRLAELLKAPNPGPYRVKVGSRVRTADGYCYTARVYLTENTTSPVAGRSERLIGSIHDGGTGGALTILIRDDQALSALEAHVKTLPPDKTYGDPIPYDTELFLGTLAELDMQLSSLKRTAKRKAIVHLNGKVYSVPSGSTMALQGELLNPLFAEVK